jgi:hypothetical protein
VTEWDELKPVLARLRVRIPLLVGTASSRPELGYAVPPGEWGIQVTLKLGQDPRSPLLRRTPILPLTITA